MTEKEIRRVLKIGVMLSEERNVNRLLQKILQVVMDLTRCDAGTLYLKEDDALRFKIMETRSLGTHDGGDGKDPDLPPVPLRIENVCAMSLLEDRTVLVRNVRECDDYDFSGPIKYDAITGYHTESMLVVPMRNREKDKIGVLQLINAMDEDGNIISFSEEMVLLVESVASMSAITIQNVRYINDIQALFHSFVQVMSSAVDERTPYNGSHTRHMAAYGDRFIDYINANGGYHYTPAQKEEILMSVWLHDIGKLVTPLEVMNKAARLLPEQLTEFTHRMEIIKLRGEIDCLSGRITPGALEQLKADVQAAKELVDGVNTAGFLPEPRLEAVRQLRERTYQDEDGTERNWLTGDEYAMLSIQKGTLSEDERHIMEEHVVITGKLLSKIRFSRDLANVPAWASSHHELMNGSGYPHHRQGDEIPPEVRIITILDIFDALVADDRPYKPGMPIDRALSILDAMANKEGKLDPELTALFIQSRVWETVGEEL